MLLDLGMFGRLSGQLVRGIVAKFSHDRFAVASVPGSHRLDMPFDLNKGPWPGGPVYSVDIIIGIVAELKKRI